jgi:DNA polymerase-3 subunit alpha
MDGADINKRCVESLIKAGAFDCLGGHRSQYNAVFESVINGVSQVRKKNIEGQMSLFDITPGGETEAYRDALPDIPEYDVDKLLTGEKEVLGIYVSGHPISEYEEEMQKYITATSLDFISEIEDNNNMENLTASADKNTGAVLDGQSVAVGGIIAGRSVKYTKNNDAMAFLTIEDLYGSVEIVVFPNVYDKYSKQLNEGQAVIIFGKAQLREDKAATIICNDIKIFQKKNTGAQSSVSLWLKIPAEASVPYDKLMALLSKFRGATPVVIYDEKTKQKMKTKESFWVNADNERLMLELKHLLGEKSVVVK